MLSSPSSSLIDRINAYYKDYPDTTEFIGKSNHSPDTETTTLEHSVKDLHVTKNKAEAYRKEFLYIGGPEVVRNCRKKKEALNKQDASPPS